MSYCPQCGGRNEADARYCEHCGHDLGQVVPVVPVAPVPGPAARPRMSRWLIGAVLVVVAAGVAFMTLGDMVGQIGNAIEERLNQRSSQQRQPASPDTVGPAMAYDVVLLNVGDRKVSAIETVRDLTNGKLGLKETKELVERAPAVVLRVRNRAQAELAKKRLEQVGTTVEIRPIFVTGQPPAGAVPGGAVARPVPPAPPLGPAPARPAEPRAVSTKPQAAPVVPVAPPARVPALGVPPTSAPSPRSVRPSPARVAPPALIPPAPARTAPPTGQTDTVPSSPPTSTTVTRPVAPSPGTVAVPDVPVSGLQLTAAINRVAPGDVILFDLTFRLSSPAPVAMEQTIAWMDDGRLVYGKYEPFQAVPGSNTIRGLSFRPGTAAVPGTTFQVFGVIRIGDVIYRTDTPTAVVVGPRVQALPAGSGTASGLELTPTSSSRVGPGEAVSFELNFRLSSQAPVSVENTVAWMEQGRLIYGKYEPYRAVPGSNTIKGLQFRIGTGTAVGSTFQVYGVIRIGGTIYRSDAPIVVTVAPRTQAGPQPPSAPTMCGNWSSDFGSVTFVCGQVRDGQIATITGFWNQASDKRGAIISGAFDLATRVLTFSYYQDWSDQNGTATLTLSPDGRRLQGTWKQPNGQGTWSMWR